MKMINKRVFLLIDKGFCDPELWYPYYRFLEEGAEAIIAAPKKGSIRGEAGPHDHTMAGWAADATHTVDDALQMHITQGRKARTVNLYYQRRPQDGRIFTVSKLCNAF